MPRNQKQDAHAIARGIVCGLAAAFALLGSSIAAAQSGPWATCRNGNDVDTGTAFGSPHLAGYSGALTPELLQAVAFLALTRPDQRSAVEPVVMGRLRANGVKLDEGDWRTLRDSATRGVDDHAGARRFLYGVISSSFTRTIVAGIFVRNENGQYFARDAVEVDARECVLWPIVDELIRSPCDTTAARALYMAASANRDLPRKCLPPPTEAAGLEMIALKIARSGGLKVSVARGSSKSGVTAEFRVFRSASATDKSSAPVWSGKATIMSDKSDPTGPLYAIVATGLGLAPGPRDPRPFLVVEAIRSGGSVSCEQPLPKWEARHEKPKPGGLHGPYDKLSDLISDDRAGPIALELTGSGLDEYGFLILQDQRQKYYTTPPVLTSQTLSWYEYYLGAPSFPWNDYLRSGQIGFSESCANMDDFGVFATVHTHPYPGLPYPPPKSDSFSLDDFSQAFQLRKASSVFRAIFMINAKDRKLRMFAPRTGETFREDGWSDYVKDAKPIWEY